ncbi:MAG: SEL1-like repeat protein [Parvularculaceae bacterium]|nr:SEL1-like repeat protein [Parvularculaceae bacterium]
MRAAFHALAILCLAGTLARAETPLTQSGAQAVLAALERNDHQRARALAEPLAARGDSVASYALGMIYEKGLGVRPHIGLALEHYSAAAIDGSADAQIALGRLAYEGGGVYPDYERAAGWFRLASAQGDPRGDVRLGVMLADGKGVAQDSVAAAHHFARAAAKNNADGLFYLGFAFLNGDGVPQNYQVAAKYFASAVQKGQAEAAFHLALMHEGTALGTANAAEAARLMQLAAERGHKPAFAAMGLIVHRGDAPGVAADWFERGAKAGDAQAAFLYAVALAKGDGRKKDPQAAALLARRIATAPSTPAPLKAQAQRLTHSLTKEISGPITLRE